jgi:predicted PurR-regulated permease PerM
MNAPPADPAASGPQRAARYALILFLALMGAWMLRHFLPALTWAVILAIATWPLYTRWSLRFTSKRRELWSAITFTTIVGLVLVVPMIYGAVVALREAVTLIRAYLSSGPGSLSAPDWLIQFPWIGKWLANAWNEYMVQVTEGVPATMGMTKTHVFEYGRLFGTQVVRRVVTLTFTLFTLFFLYLRGAEIAPSVRRASFRMFGPTVEPLLDHMVLAIRATVDGIVLVAVAFGAIMSGAYAFAGLTHPVLFGVITGVFATVPFAAPIAFLSAALLLASQGAVAAAITIGIFGAILLFIADHFVRPVIIGEGARLPFLWVLLGILGGVESFGLVGIFLGPTLMAALSSLWRDWSQQTASS